MSRRKKPVTIAVISGTGSAGTGVLIEKTSFQIAQSLLGANKEFEGKPNGIRGV